MSGRVALACDERELLRQFGNEAHLPGLHPMPPRYNIAPGQPLLVVVKERLACEARLMKWAFLPEWVKDPAKFSQISSARAETIAEKPSFRNAIQRRRCLIPVSGFYEWRSEKGREEKRPYYFSHHTDALLSLAGIWETWMGPFGEEVDTVALLTIKAKGEIADIAERLPVVIEKENRDLWLDNLTGRFKEARPLLRACADGTLVCHEVSTRLNNPRNDDESLTEPVAPSRKQGGKREAAKGKSGEINKDARDESGQFSLL